MKRSRLRWLVCLLAVPPVLLAVSFVIASVVAEGTLHPLLKRRASDTAALAFSIAQSADATALSVSIRTYDGTGIAWWLVPRRSNGRAVMVCHGIADSAYGALGYGLLLLRNGYSVLVPESRGHGESGGYVTYGVLEADDTVQWLGWIKSHGVNSVFGFGESLGGAILIQSLARGADFRALVVECPYSSFEAVADDRVSLVIPRFTADMLVKEALFYTRALSRGPSQCSTGPRNSMRSCADTSDSRIGRQRNHA